MKYKHILTLVNNQMQLYAGNFVIYSGSPSNSIWSAGERCPQISLQSFIMFFRSVDILDIFFDILSLDH